VVWVNTLWLLMLVQFAKRVMRDKQPQAPPWLVQLVLMANIKEQPHQLSTIVQRVLRDKRRQLTVPQQVARPVLMVRFKKIHQQRSTIVKRVIRERRPQVPPQQVAQIVLQVDIKTIQINIDVQSVVQENTIHK